MTLAGRSALITGSKRIGAIVGRTSRAGADVAFVYNRSRDEAEDAARAIRPGRRAAIVKADLSEPQDCARVVESTAGARAARRFREHGVDLSGAPPGRAHGRGWDAQLRVDLRASFLCAGCGAADAPARRPHHQLRGLGGGQRAAALCRLRAVFRGEGRHRADRGPRPRAGQATRSSWNCIAPGPIGAAPGTSAEEQTAVEQGRRLGDGAARTRSPKPRCSSSKPTS